MPPSGCVCGTWPSSLFRGFPWSLLLLGKQFRPVTGMQGSSMGPTPVPLQSQSPAANASSVMLVRAMWQNSCEICLSRGPWHLMCDAWHQVKRKLQPSKGTSTLGFAGGHLGSNSIVPGLPESEGETLHPRRLQSWPLPRSVNAVGEKAKTRAQASGSGHPQGSECAVWDTAKLRGNSNAAPWELPGSSSPWKQPWPEGPAPAP